MVHDIILDIITSQYEKKSSSHQHTSWPSISLEKHQVASWARTDTGPSIREFLSRPATHTRTHTPLCHCVLRLLMGLNLPQIRPYPYFKSSNYHLLRPTPSAQCPNPPQPEVMTEDDMRLTRRSTTISSQHVCIVNPTRLNPFHSITRFYPSNSTRIKIHQKNPSNSSPLAGVHGHACTAENIEITISAIKANLRTTEPAPMRRRGLDHLTIHDRLPAHRSHPRAESGAFSDILPRTIACLLTEAVHELKPARSRTSCHARLFACLLEPTA